MGRPSSSKTSAAAIGSKGTNFRVSKSGSGGSLKGASVSSKTNSPSGIGKTPPDRSQLNFPYDIRLSGFTSIQNAVTKGTPRIRRILTEECDYIMECRVCRNLFRSLPNFITHKLNYCKKAFDSTWCIGLSNLVQTSDRTFNIEYEVDPELLIDEKVNCVEKTRSPSELYNDLAAKVKGHRSTAAFQQTVPTSESLVRLRLKPLVEVPGGGCVVLQQTTSTDPSNCDVTNPRIEPIETASRDTAVLGPDGKVMCTGTSKGIEAVVARLTAQLKNFEETSASQGGVTLITCDICKTVFDTEKSLRQHKREGLDCGKTWGSKSPSKIFSKEERHPPCESTRDLEKSAKLLSPFHSRRLSNKGIKSSGKAKRSLPLSPVKKIKMKYCKLDYWSGSAAESGSRLENGSLSCNNCSSSFSTKHEMSMHLALCNGVINYACLKESEPPKDKIRISVRNEFGKNEKPCSGSYVVSSDTSPRRWSGNHIQANHVIISSVGQQIERSSPLEFQEGGKGNGESESGGGRDTEVAQFCSLLTSTTEVNNNKQYKDDQSETKRECVKKRVTVSDPSPVLSTEKPLSPKTRKIADEVHHSNSMAKDDEGSSTLSSSGNKTSSAKTKKMKVVHSTTPSPKSRKSKPSKIDVVAQVITRFDKARDKPERAFNLRKSVKARVRKSRRILGSTFFKRTR